MVRETKSSIALSNSTLFFWLKPNDFHNSKQKKGVHGRIRIYSYSQGDFRSTKSIRKNYHLVSYGAKNDCKSNRRNKWNSACNEYQTIFFI